MARTTVLMADDHRIVRNGLRALLDQQRDLEMVGEAGDGLSAVELTERLRPDILLLDLTMPHINGLEALHQIARRAPDTRVIILSMHAEERFVLEALRLGACGYVLKDAGAEELLHAIREVAAGRRYLSPPLSERAFAYYIHRAQKAPPDPYDMLTNREREVLHLVAEGHTNREIAALLSISVRTVETHRYNLMKKLGLRNQAELVRYVLDRQTGGQPLTGPSPRENGGWERST